MKIAIMCSSFAIGGAENMVSQLVRGLAKCKTNVFVITSNPRLDNHIQRGVDCTGVPYFIANDSTEKNLLERFKTFCGVWKILSQQRPDVIHTNLSIVFYVIPYVLFHKVRLIHTVHNLPAKDLGLGARTLIKLLVLLKKISFTSISSKIQKEIVQEYRVSNDLAPIVVNPVETSLFFASFKKKRPCRNDRFHFVNVGRLSEQKNQALLIRAFYKVFLLHPSVELSIVGCGNLYNKLYDLTVSLGLEKNVHLLGSRSDVPEIFQECDAFVLSSDYEGLPLTILEAFAAGLPVVSTDVGGVSDIVENGVNGILVHANDVAEMTEGMLKMLDSQVYEMLWENVKKIHGRYDVAIFVDKYKNIYES